MFSDSYWMRHAIHLAETAALKGEVPVGAVLVHDNKIIGEGYNCPISHSDPCAHAEVIALRNAGACLNNYRLNHSTLYVTLEPCIMCVGAIIHARIERLVFGAFDLKAGAVQSVFTLLDTNKLNHRLDYEGGLLSEQCGNLLTEFFRLRRESKKVNNLNLKVKERLYNESTSN